MKQTPEEALAVLAEVAKGKSWQRQIPGDTIWESYHDQKFHQAMRCASGGYNIRIRPEKKKVSLTQEDFTGIWWLKSSSKEGSLNFLVLATCSNGVTQYNGFSTYDTIHFNGWKRSQDCKKWSPCYKEVEE